MAQKPTTVVLGLGLMLIIIAAIGYFVLPWRSLLIMMMAQHGVKEAKQLRVRLLSETDHQMLLQAGRDVLSQIPKEYVGDVGQRPVGDLPLPKGVRIPQAIRDLGARGLYLSYDGYLTIEMHGGMDHFGVCIYPNGFSEPRVGFSYGDRKLLEGLWYYDENYRQGPQYDKVIDGMLRGAH